MNDFNSSASIRRLATALNRRFGVWVASPSVGLLAALVAGKGRPKRLLVDPAAPPFVSNIARIAGALAVHVPTGQADQAIRGAVAIDGVSADLVWVVAIHRDGRLASSEWLADSRSHGAPSVELCLGSLPALIAARQRLATFTLVQLDAEPSLDGLQLTALLTDDSDLADRVRQLSLPLPGATDYVLDASPRGVTHDEPALLSLLDALIVRAQAPAVVGDALPEAPPNFELSWNRRFQDDDSVAPTVAAPPAPSRDEPGKNPWLTRVAEAEAGHLQASRTLGALRNQLESEQSAHSRLNERLQLIEKESAERGERLAILQAEHDREREQHQHERAEVESALDASRTESGSLTAALTSLRSDLELERAEKAKREEELQATIATHQHRVEERERSRDEVLADRDRLKADILARAEASDQSLRQARAQIEELKTDAGLKSQEHAELVEQKNEALRQLTGAESERAKLSERIEKLERDQAKAATDSEKRAASLEKSLEESREKLHQVEKGASTVAEREGALRTEAAAGRQELLAHVARAEAEAAAKETAVVALTAQVARFESEAASKDRSRAELLEQKAALDRELALAKSDAVALTSKIEGLKTQQTQREAEGVRREALLESTLSEQKNRATQLDKDLAAAREGSATGEASRVELMAQVARLQVDLASKDNGRNELLGQKSALDRDLALSQAEVKTLGARLDRLESERIEAKADASRGEGALRSSLEEEQKRARKLEKEAATLSERATSWDAARAELNARIARLEADAARDARSQTDAADRRATIDQELKTKADEAQRAQAVRLMELEALLSAAASERKVVDQHLAQMDVAHRQALEASEARLAEARLAAQASATQASESWKSRLDAAEETALALKTALDARASEAAAYEKAHVAGHAHRQALEERVSQLNKRLAQAEQRLDPKAREKEGPVDTPPAGVAPGTAEPETVREKAAWEVQRPRFAPAEDSDVDFGGSSLSLGGPIDYSAPDDLPSLGVSALDKQDEEKHRSQREVFLEAPRSDFTPEYERGTKPEEETGKSAKGWLRGVASRIRRG